MNYVQMNDSISVEFDEGQDCYLVTNGDDVTPISESTYEIIQLCDGKHRKEDMVEKLKDKYLDADISRDIDDFIADALERGWLHVDDKW